MNPNSGDQNPPPSQMPQQNQTLPTQNEKRPGFFSTILSKINSISPFIKQRPYFILLSLLVVVIGFLGARYYVLSRPNPALFANQTAQFLDDVLLVVDVSLDSQTNPTSLTVTFNNPVDAHDLEHFASISPKIEGEWKRGLLNKNEVTYKFKKPYKGATLWFYIADGLKSTNNKSMTSSFSKNLTVENATQYSPYSRVKNFPAGKAIPLSSDGSSISIYKSDAQKLLQFLTYSVENKQYRTSRYDGVFKEELSHYNESDKLTNVKINTDENTITLKPGVYYVEGDTSKPYFIVVSSFGALLRQDDKKVYLNAFDVQKGTRIDDSVTFGLYNLENSVNLLRDFAYSSDNNSVPLAYPTKLDAVIGIYKNEVVFIPVEILNSLADIRVSSNLDETNKVFLYTDRPIYKPGDTVFIKGIVRTDGDSLYQIPQAGKQVYLKIPGYDKDMEEIDLNATLDEYGTFYTNYVLPKDKSGEGISIRASVKPFSNYNYGEGFASFEVVKYTKPTFEIKSTVSKSEYLKPDKLTFTITGNYFNGKPLANRDIEYTLYSDSYYEVEKAVFNKNFNISSQGGMCGGGGADEYYGNEYKSGKVTLNDQGKATLEINADEKSLMSQRITLIAKTVDDNKNEIVTASNAIVHAAEYNVFFIPSADNYYPEEEIVAPFYAETLSGDKVKNTTFEYKLIDYVYSNDAQKEHEKVVASGTAVTDENGKGIITFTLPQADKLTDTTKQLIVSARDSKSNVAQNQKTISILKKSDSQAQAEPAWWGESISQTYLKISSNQNSFKVGDTVSLNIDSPSEFDALVTLERGRVYDPQIKHINKGNNTFSFKVDERLSPSITVVFSYFVGGKYYTEGLSLNVPAMHKLLNVGLKLDKTSYSPNDTAELLVTTKDSHGSPIAANLSVGVVDKAIYALRASATPPIHSSFYYFRSRQTNASSSLTGLSDWGGGGGGGGGGGNPSSTADILYWNPNVRTDASGEIRLPIPLLGHKTIWKIQAIGSTMATDVGQADTEFLVGSEVKGAKTKKMR